MTLFKLSASNMKKSIKDYAIYFFTLVLGVAIFYVFNAIETQTAMLRISADTRQVVQLMSKIIAGVSVFIAFVLGFLIIYASRFLMKRRNKEFGLYLILGMGKRKVSTMLFIETLIIGLVSLVVGLLAGIGISQITSVLHVRCRYVIIQLCILRQRICQDLSVFCNHICGGYNLQHIYHQQM